MASITIGTTPTIIFSNFKQVRPPDFVRAILTLTQRKSILRKSSETVEIQKDLTTARVTEIAIEWTLTQEETLELLPTLSEQRPSKVTVMLNFLTAAGLRGTSVAADFDVLDNPIDEVMA